MIKDYTCFRLLSILDLSSARSLVIQVSKTFDNDIKNGLTFNRSNDRMIEQLDNVLENKSLAKDIANEIAKFKIRRTYK